jgi:hypothetical protein
MNIPAYSTMRWTVAVKRETASILKQSLVKECG